MAIWRRFETWLLLGFLGMGGMFVGVSQWAHDRAVTRLEAAAEGESREEFAGDASEPELPFRIEEAVFRAEEEGHWLLELQVSFRNAGAEDRELTQPYAALVTADGEEVPPFFLALAPRPRVQAGEEKTVALRYWLESRHRGAGLWLSVGGERLAVPMGS